ncbi:MAG TPA: hypothetical protein VE261_00605 [Gaiellaceae bacterium]|nr:hypothetical protein [Gaiellaceae bacterium]
MAAQPTSTPEFVDVPLPTREPVALQSLPSITSIFPRSPYDWELAENIFIYGEVSDGPGGTKSIRWPNYSDVAKRVGCSVSRIAQVSQRRQWTERRAAVRSGRMSKLEDAGTSRATTPEMLDPRPRPRLEPLELLDEYLVLIEDAVRTRRIKYDAVADLDKALRLKTFLLEQGEKAGKQVAPFSLEELQAKHRAHASETTALDDDSTGVLAHGERNAPDEPAAVSETTQKRTPARAEQPKSPKVIGRPFGPKKKAGVPFPKKKPAEAEAEAAPARLERLEEPDPFELPEGDDIGAADVDPFEV